MRAWLTVRWFKAEGSKRSACERQKMRGKRDRVAAFSNKGAVSGAGKKGVREVKAFSLMLASACTNVLSLLRRHQALASKLTLKRKLLNLLGGIPPG